MIKFVSVAIIILFFFISRAVIQLDQKEVELIFHHVICRFNASNYLNPS